MSNASRLRKRQAERAPRVSARLRESTQPPALTVEVVRELVANAQSLRFIEIEVPRSREPRGKLVTLLSRSGPLSAEVKAFEWDGKRRAVTASWRVEDLRAWVESIGGGEVGADMQINHKPDQDQTRAALAHVWGCNINDVAFREDGTIEISTDVKGVSKAEKIITKVMQDASEIKEPQP